MLWNTKLALEHRYASINVNNTYNTSSEIACKVLSTNPKLKKCGDSESACYVNESSSVPFTLHGLGFSQTDDENCTNLNTVTLSPDDSTQPDLFATISSCTFSFLHSSLFFLCLSFLIRNQFNHTHAHEQNNSKSITTHRYKNNTYNVMDCRALVL